jgi:hypothetical protein
LPSFGVQILVRASQKNIEGVPMPEDPVEKIVRLALVSSGIKYTTPDGRRDSTGLDFHLSKYDISIECKQFFSERSVKMLRGNSNVILIQGKSAAEAFAALISKCAKDRVAQ